MFFMKDGNSIVQQPLYANSGFHFNRPTNRTLLFWKEAYLLAHTTRVQQRLVQPLLIHHYFVNGLRLLILPPEFTNGNYWQDQGGVGRIPPNWIVLHASWTKNAQHKERKFKIVREWYNDCITFFDTDG